MRRTEFAIALLTLLLLPLTAGCELPAGFPGGDGGDDPDSVDRTYTFESGDEGWTASYTDFSATMDSAQFDFVGVRERLPDSLLADSSSGGDWAFRLAGTNVSDDLFMFLKRRIDDLAPNTTYDVTVTADLYSNVPNECVGIGGSPGQSVYVKVGASDEEPRSVLIDGDYRLSVDKGNQSTGGPAAVVVGNVATDVPGCPDGVPFHRLERTNADEKTPLRATTGDDGALWVFVGTDSGFEGRTWLYYDAVHVELQPADDGRGRR